MHLQRSAGLQPERSPENFNPERRHYPREQSPTPLEVGELPRPVSTRKGMPYAKVTAKPHSVSIPPNRRPAGAEAGDNGGVQAPWRVSTAFSPPEPRPVSDASARARGLLTTSIQNGLAKDEGDSQEKLPGQKHLGRRSVYAQMVGRRSPTPWAEDPVECNTARESSSVAGSSAFLEQTSLPFSEPLLRKSPQTNRKNASSGHISKGLNTVSVEDGAARREALGLPERGRQSERGQQVKQKQLAPWERMNASQAQQRPSSAPPKSAAGVALAFRPVGEAKQDVSSDRLLGDRKGRQSPRAQEMLQKNPAPWEPCPIEDVSAPVKQPQALIDSRSPRGQASALPSSRGPPLMSSTDVDAWRSKSVEQSVPRLKGHSPREPLQLAEKVVAFDGIASSVGSESERFSGRIEQELAKARIEQEVTKALMDKLANAKRQQQEAANPAEAGAKRVESTPQRKRQEPGAKRVESTPQLQRSPQKSTATPRTRLAAPPSARDRSSPPKAAPARAAPKFSSQGSGASQNASLTRATAVAKIPKPEWCAPNQKDRERDDAQLSRVGTARQRGLREREACLERIEALKTEALQLQERRNGIEKRVMVEAPLAIGA
mmetsp:Transcript_6104/g.10538  ORF Transcript_6104/g.10538 Transcript_6104/m.10538 type:complete len:604 (+) Transcript_6104:50-1861(+)